jgi:hypothetical protein
VALSTMCLPLTTLAWVGSRASTYGIGGVPCGTGTGFFPNSLVFYVSAFLHELSILIHMSGTDNT